MNYFVMVQRDTRYWIVGPFPTQKTASDWARSVYGADADPRWQPIQLADPTAAPVVMRPGTASEYAAIGEPEVQWP